MIGVGLVLPIIGFLAKIPIVWSIGGHAVGGRRRYY
jgi:hypothetical protein